MQISSMVYFSPGRILLASLISIIGIGTALLSLPSMQTIPLSFIDTLFTSVSTVCVTGLTTVSLNSFTFWGHCVLLGLMQIGGLGLMTFSFFFASLFTSMGMTSKLMAGQLFEFESWTKVKQFLVLVIVSTVGFEIIGGLALLPSFLRYYPLPKALFYSFFHAVSAFCNAGLVTLDPLAKSCITLPPVMLILSFLIFAGGIGFVVWYEVVEYLYSMWRSIHDSTHRIFAFSLHTKIALTTSFILIAFGALFIGGIESTYTLLKAPSANRFLHAFFTSLSVRSAGFMTVPIKLMNPATILLLMILMFIGASPGSTGSGIKTTTFALLLASVRAIILNREDIEMYGRTIPTEQVYKAISVLIIAIVWCITTLFLLLLTHPDAPFFAVLFEVVSAFSTCGISMGFTAHSSFFGKCMLMATMIIGRIGLLTMVLALKKDKTKHLYRYPEERILIG